MVAQAAELTKELDLSYGRTAKLLETDFGSQERPSGSRKHSRE
jgi:hypothetical protein